MPVAKLLAPDTVVWPFRLTLPELVAKLPELALASKAPALKVSPESTESVGTVVLGKRNTSAVPRLAEHQAVTWLCGGTWHPFQIARIEAFFKPFRNFEDLKLTTAYIRAPCRWSQPRCCPSEP